MNLSIKALKRAEIFEGIAIILLGSLFVAFPGFWADFVSLLFAILVGIIGIVLVINCFLEKKYTSLPIIKLICGIILFLVGVYFIFNLSTPISILTRVLGITALVYGAVRISSCVTAKKYGAKMGFTLIDGIINAAFGLFMTFYPLIAADLWIMVLGFYLIYVGICFILIVKNSDFKIIK